MVTSPGERGYAGSAAPLHLLQAGVGRRWPDIDSLLVRRVVRHVRPVGRYRHDGGRAIPGRQRRGRGHGLGTGVHHVSAAAALLSAGGAGGTKSPDDPAGLAAMRTVLSPAPRPHPTPIA